MERRSESEHADSLLDFDDLHLSGSPQQLGRGVRQLTGDRGRAASELDTPPGSPPQDSTPRPALSRVSSGVMDIPNSAGAGEEEARAPLVGPCPLPDPPDPGGEDTPGDGGTPRKLGPSDFVILSLVGQGAFGKVFQVQRREGGRVFAMKGALQLPPPPASP